MECLIGAADGARRRRCDTYDTHDAIGEDRGGAIDTGGILYGVSLALGNLLDAGFEIKILDVNADEYQFEFEAAAAASFVFESNGSSSIHSSFLPSFLRSTRPITHGNNCDDRWSKRRRETAMDHRSRRENEAIACN